MEASLLKTALPDITDTETDSFSRYLDMLTDWNTRVNLTAIKEPAEIVKKHFLDSLLPIDLIPRSAKVADIGTGAGFPGLPLLIMRPDIRLTLVDSLNKRVAFLAAVCAELGLTAQCVHARAEDFARTEARGSFDVALTRAVAGVSALTEYTLPLLRVGGVSLMYKGPQAAEELASAKNALCELHGTAELIRYDADWGERYIISVKKTAPTSKLYPRKAGTAEKQPL